MKIQDCVEVLRRTVLPELDHGDARDNLIVTCAVLERLCEELQTCLTREIEARKACHAKVCDYILRSMDETGKALIQELQASSNHESDMA